MIERRAAVDLRFENSGVYTDLVGRRLGAQACSCECASRSLLSSQSNQIKKTRKTTCLISYMLVAMLRIAPLPAIYLYPSEFAVRRSDRIRATSHGAVVTERSSSAQPDKLIGLPRFGYKRATGNSMSVHRMFIQSMRPVDLVSLGLAL